MKRLLLICLTLSCSLAFAGTIHKWVDANGKVHFSDKPPVNANTEELGIKSSSGKKKAKRDEVLEGAAEAEGEEEEEKKPTVYTRISISNPKQGGVVRSVTGEIKISVSLKPELDKDFKHKVAVFVDGAQKGYAQRTSFTAKGVFQGSHTVYAKVTDEKGKVLKTSPRVSFNVLR